MDSPERKALIHHHDFVARMQSSKENIELDKTLKYYDKSRDVKMQQLISQERELKQALYDLKAEKEYHKSKGSIVMNDEKLTDSMRKKSKKGVKVKLSPGKIDTESASPPNSHDVAVRMLFDKKKKGKKKRLGWKKTEAEHASKVVGMEEEIPKSQSVRSATFKLPLIETDTRRSSVNDPEHIQVRTQMHKQQQKEQQKEKERSKKQQPREQSTTMPLNDDKETTKVYRKTPYPKKLLNGGHWDDDDDDVSPADILTLEVATDKPVSISVNMGQTPPGKPQAAWEAPSSAGKERGAAKTGQRRNSKHSGTSVALPELAQGKSSLVELQVNDILHSRSRRGSDLSHTSVANDAKQRKQREKEEMARQGSFSGCKTEEDNIRLQRYIANHEASTRRYSLRHEDQMERQRQFEFEEQADRRQRRHSYVAGAADSGRRGSVESSHGGRRGSIDSSHGRRGSMDSSHGGRRGSVDSRRGSIGSSHGGSPGTPHDPQIEEFMRHLQEKYKNSSNKDQLQLSSLQRYYELLCESESTLMQDDASFEVTHEATHKPLCTLKRSQRRKMSALEAMIKQLPSFKDIPKMDPKEMLNCSYLRLSRNAVEELEELCRRSGFEPGIHAHMTQAQVEQYFANEDSERGSDSDHGLH